jgi:hypothetical protein
LPGGALDRALMDLLQARAGNLSGVGDLLVAAPGLPLPKVNILLRDLL